jgi:hypothetical protein
MLASGKGVLGMSIRLPPMLFSGKTAPVFVNQELNGKVRRDLTNRPD